MENILNLSENYTTKKIKFNTPTTIEESIQIPIIHEKDMPKFTKYKMKCSLAPMVAMGTLATMKNATVGTIGLFDKIAPILLPILYDAGRIIFYVNGAKAIYSMCNGETRQAINKFKDVSLGYALLIGLDGIMYFIEYYVDGLKDGMLDGMAETVNMVVNTLGGVL